MGLENHLNKQDEGAQADLWGHTSESSRLEMFGKAPCCSQAVGSVPTQSVNHVSPVAGSDTLREMQDKTCYNQGDSPDMLLFVKRISDMFVRVPQLSGRVPACTQVFMYSL